MQPIILIYFDSRQHGIQSKQTLDYWFRYMLNFDLGVVSPPHFVYDFLRKMFVIILLTDQNFIVFTCWDIWQYVYSNYWPAVSTVVTSKFLKLSDLSYEAAFLHDQTKKSRRKFDCMFLSCHVHVSEWIHTL